MTPRSQARASAALTYIKCAGICAMSRDAFPLLASELLDVVTT